MKEMNQFIFSLDKKEKYNVSNPDYIIGCQENNWISFGNGNDLYFYNNCTENFSELLPWN